MRLYNEPFGSVKVIFYGSLLFRKDVIYVPLHVIKRLVKLTFM